MTTPTAAGKRRGRCASWSKAMRFCLPPDHRHALERGPFRSTSTQKKWPQLLASPARVALLRIRKTRPDHRVQIRTTSRKTRIYAKYILKNHPDARSHPVPERWTSPRLCHRLKAGLGDKAATDDRRRNLLYGFGRPTIRFANRQIENRLAPILLYVRLNAEIRGRPSKRRSVG